MSKNKTILDVGCGNYSLAIELIKLGFNVYGIDASVEGIEKGKSKFPDRFFIQDIENNVLPKEISKFKFDTIISTEVIGHIYSPKSFIGFCKKILKNNGGGEGELIISTPCHGYLKNLMITILNKWDDHHTVLWEGGHIKFWSRNTLSNY